MVEGRGEVIQLEDLNFWLFLGKSTSYSFYYSAKKSSVNNIAARNLQIREEYGPVDSPEWIKKKNSQFFARRV